MRRLPVHTIGHSLHPLPSLIEMLAGRDVRLLVDIRSRPYSRHAPQYSKKRLETELPAQGIRYVWMGEALGGRPEGGTTTTKERLPLYEEIAAGSEYQAGIGELARVLGDEPAALMCAEEDPTWCHRRLLVGKSLIAGGLDASNLLHIRKGGGVITESELVAQLALPAGRKGAARVLTALRNPDGE